MQDLGTLPGLNQATATSVSADGSIVVGYADPTTALNGATGWAVSANSLPFRWTQATGLQNLTTLLANGGVDMTGTALTTARGLSRPIGTYILGGRTFFRIRRPDVSATGYGALYCDAAPSPAQRPWRPPSTPTTSTATARATFCGATPAATWRCG